MSDHDALLRAIIESPEEDGPRLVYADWLEENGDPDRAEFIRIQCEFYRMRYRSPEHESRAGVLQSRSHELQRQYEKTWLAQLKLPPNRQTYWWFHRGMVGKVWCTVRYFVEYAERFLDAAPIQTVCFRRLTARNVDELAGNPQFARVRGIKCLMAETPQALVARFFQTVPIAHLRTADLDVRMINALWAGWHDRNVALAKVLAESPGLAGLKRLWLRHIGVGDEGGLALARSPHLAGLEILDLSENALSPEVEAALRERFGQRLCLGRPDFSHFTLGELGWA